MFVIVTKVVRADIGTAFVTLAMMFETDGRMPPGETIDAVGCGAALTMPPGTEICGRPDATLLTTGTEAIPGRVG